MPDHRPTTDARDALYDAYVEAALDGRAVPPDEFLSAHGATDPELRERLAAVHRAAARASDAARSDRDLPFERLGAYRVLRRLDEGGMGMVYLGAEERLGRLVALKVLRPELQDSATQSARFEREAQVVARLRHPHIVAIYGLGEERGMRYLAMEYVEGEGLDEVIARANADGRPIPVATAVRWAIQVAGALQAAHDAGVVHRDVKPSNVRIDREGNAILLDFGIAAEEGTARLTVEGSFLGTAAYAAPEQLRSADGAEPDGRADVWSLGVVLYEALTGVQPFEGDAAVDTAEHVLHGEAVHARRLRRDIPRDLDTVLQVAMARERGRRHASAQALAADLRAILEVRPIRARRPGPLRRLWKLLRRHPVAAAALLLCALAVTGTVVADGVRRRRDARAALDEARAGVQQYRRLCRQARGAEHDLQVLDDLVETQYMTAEEEQGLDTAYRAVQDSRRGREAGFHRVLALLRRAELLHPHLGGIEDVRASLYVERWREARIRRDDDEAAFYRQAALEIAPASASTLHLNATGQVRVRCSTPGATARVFHFQRLSDRVPHGEPRLVPVPAGGPAQLRPGAWAFRLVAPCGPFLAGDLIVRVDGRDVDAASWRELRARLADGVRADLLTTTGPATWDLPPEADVRLTTQPLEWAPDAEAIGGRGVTTPAGAVLVVVRAPGREELRLVLSLEPGATPDVDAAPPLLGTTPPGFVHVPQVASSGPQTFWIQEREVTAAEYLEFLNDPATRAEIDASPRVLRVPRRATPDEVLSVRWPRGEDGRFSLPEGWPPDWPAIAVSYDDAEAYCAWWTRRARERGASWVASLPSLHEWTYTGSPGSDRALVYGNRFHPKWASSCFSQPQARVEPVMSHPRDESVHGVFDLSGSVWEWTDAWWNGGNGLRRVSGGSWARAPAEFFTVWGGQGYAPESASDEHGFRLVLHHGGERGE